MNAQIKELALQTGGSHYPEVGGELLEQFANLLLQEVITTIKNTPTHCAMTTFQLGIVECTINKSVEAIEEKFGVKSKNENNNENRNSLRFTSRVSGH